MQTPAISGELYQQGRRVQDEKAENGTGGESTTHGTCVRDVPYLFAVLATSPDGFCWKHPELGLVEFDGSIANNIV